LATLATVIAYLEGILAEAAPTRVVVDCHGVGYLVSIPVSSYDKLPARGGAVKILTYHHVVTHEGTQQLYGFMSPAERELFLLLIGVSGIGPKAAINILSSASVGSLRQAIANGDVTMLSSLRGIGKKTAERLVVELKDKVGAAQPFETKGHAPTAADQKRLDAMLALVSLGYKQADAQRAITAVTEKLGASAAVEELVRAALRTG
jgi:Holliday junction DNA helicase RuvA